MSRPELVTYYCGASLPPGWGPQSDLIVLDLLHTPPLPALSTWAAQARVPVVAAARELLNGVRAALVFSGSGRLVGSQWQTHACPDESAPTRLGEELQVFQMEALLVSVLVGDDEQVPEVARVAGLSGAELVLSLARDAHPDPYGALWRAVQANQFLGLEGSPEPVLLLPCEADPDGDGLVPMERVGDWHRIELPWARQHQARQQHPVLTSLNPDVYVERPWWPRHYGMPDGQ
jgi:hypothetical protein